MKKSLTVYGLLVLIISAIMVGCGRDSSPEGRMTTKVEELQSKMEHQNKAILDSLGKIRQELEALKQAK